MAGCQCSELEAVDAASSQLQPSSPHLELSTAHVTFEVIEFSLAQLLSLF